MKFYVGAPLRHWESARKAMSALRSMGHEVTHDWTLEAEEYFKGLSNVSNRRIANDCIGGVNQCDIAFFLMNVAEPMQGTWVELGAALAHYKPVVVYLPELHCHESEKAGVDAWLAKAAMLHHSEVQVKGQYAECFRLFQRLADLDRRHAPQYFGPKHFIPKEESRRTQ